jgi:hypothetical protein
VAAGFDPVDAVLRDGRAVHVRAIQPSDEEELLQAFDRLGADSRYMRFMHAVREANVPRLRQVLGSFPDKGLAIAATVPAADGIDIVGAARKRGLRKMTGIVLAENSPMLLLAGRLGFAVRRDPDDFSQCICRLDLGGGP